MRSIAAIRHFSEEIYQPHYKEVLAYQVHEGEPTGAQRKLIAHVIVEAGIPFILPGIWDTKRALAYKSTLSPSPSPVNT